MPKVVFHGKAELPEIFDLQENERVAEFVRRVYGSEEVEISCVGIRDADDDLELDVILVEAIQDGEHLHHSRTCRHIAVTVRYGGPPYKQHDFKPYTSVGKVLAWSEEKYEIPKDQWGQFRLKLPNAQEYLENDELLGDLVREEPCELRVDLVRTEQNAGSEA